MRLEEALAASDVGAAKRPFYNMLVDPSIDKVIISIGYLDDIYVAHADTGKPVNYMDDNDVPPWKYQGRDDWEPIMLNRPEEKDVQTSTESVSDSSQLSAGAADESSTSTMD